MNNITLLVIKYKKSKDKIILNQILANLENLINKKSKYIYYKKWYPLSLYNKCKYCLNCNKNKSYCKKCLKCLCQKGYFNLYTNHLCELEDVKNELYIKVLKSVEYYNEPEDFKKYLITTLWNWQPAFITADFVRNVNTQSLYIIDKEGEEKELDIEDNTTEENMEKRLNIESILKKCNTDLEKNIINLLFDNPNLTQEELAKILNIDRSYISKILKKLQKKLKNYSQK